MTKTHILVRRGSSWHKKLVLEFVGLVARCRTAWSVRMGRLVPSALRTSLLSQEGNVNASWEQVLFSTKLVTHAFAPKNQNTIWQQKVAVLARCLHLTAGCAKKPPKRPTLSSVISIYKAKENTSNAKVAHTPHISQSRQELESQNQDASTVAHELMAA